ncbi:hypothetical protein ACHBHM_11220 [Streptococcus sp. A18]|uniref:hypothetical protein n=1 Tax=Streptococcus sp. A18 TaxID=3373125 RepID=UPI00374D936B
MNTLNIKKKIEFDTLTVVLIGSEVVEPDNVLAFNKDGKLLWKINDILKIKNPTGMIDIVKKTNAILSVVSDLSIQYDIELSRLKIVDKFYLR